MPKLDVFSLGKSILSSDPGELFGQVSSNPVYVRCVHVVSYCHSDLVNGKEFTLSSDELRTPYLLTENSQVKH